MVQIVRGATRTVVALGHGPSNMVVENTALNATAMRQNCTPAAGGTVDQCSVPFFGVRDPEKYKLHDELYHRSRLLSLIN